MPSATASTRRPGPPIVNIPEYDLVQKVRALAATMDTFAAIYPQLQDIDFRNQAAQLQFRSIWSRAGTRPVAEPSSPRSQEVDRVRAVRPRAVV